MVRWKVRAGQEAFSMEQRDSQWKRDIFAELHNDDALWAYMIRCEGEIRALQDGELNDPVLWRLLRMGVLDWEGTDNRLHQATQAMRHSTAISTRILTRLLELENKVGRFVRSVIPN
jgi:hypothetical protein